MFRTKEIPQKDGALVKESQVQSPSLWEPLSTFSLKKRSRFQHGFLSRILAKQMSWLQSLGKAESWLERTWMLKGQRDSTGGPELALSAASPEVSPTDLQPELLSRVNNSLWAPLGVAPAGTISWSSGTGCGLCDLKKSRVIPRRFWSVFPSNQIYAAIQSTWSTPGKWKQVTLHCHDQVRILSALSYFTFLGSSLSTQ